MFVVVISSSCSTDETVVADSEAEEEETSSVHMIDATEKAETPEKPAAIVIEESPITILEETENLNEFKSVNLLANTQNKGHSDEKNSGDSARDVTIRRDRNDEPEAGNSEIIYTQDLIVRDLRSTRKVRSTGEEGVVDFKRFRKVKENVWILDKCCVCEMMIFVCFGREMLHAVTASAT